MRDIAYLVNCPLGADEDITIRQLDRLHRTGGALKVRHHFLVRRNGDLELGRPVSEPGLVSENAPALNLVTIGIAIASLDASTMTNIQRRTYNLLISVLRHTWPDAQVIEAP